MSPEPTIADADLLTGLPGEHLIRKGLFDRSQACLSVESCLVEIAGRRLEKAGILERDSPCVEAEFTLYRLLCDHSTNAYARYNSLLRELVSFEHALDHRLSRGFFRQTSGGEAVRLNARMANPEGVT